MSDLPGPDAELRRRATALCGVLDDIAELQKEAKKIKDDAKADGYDMKAFGQIVKELRRGAEYQASQLELELVVDTYRRAAGLPVTLEAAQEASRREAEELPDDDRDRDGDDGQPLKRRLGRGLDELAREGRIRKTGPGVYEMPVGADGYHSTIEVAE
jgi:uncharacterized protein (UPF0335 family)